jgi:hypothetical protein
MLGLAPCLEGLAWLAAGEGDMVRTARLLGAAADGGGTQPASC